MAKKKKIKSIKIKGTPVRLPPYTIISVARTLTQSQGWGIKQLGVPDTWTITKGEGQTVMVIDTGYTDHVDLSGATLQDSSRDFIGEGLKDLNGHSSHCCGIIGARDNTVGMVGVAPECKIITCKVLSKDGMGDYNGIIAALDYAIQVKPSVVSMSLGGPVDDTRVHDRIKTLYTMNIPVVCAAGNEGPGENTMGYPALYPEVIAVGAYDSDGNIADFSSHGSEVDFTAPGVKIYSTWLNNSYAVLDGTSMATPFMAGVVVLMLAKHAKQEKETGQNDCKTIEQIKQHLIKYSRDKGVVGWDSTWGYGVVDVGGLIREQQINTTTLQPIISTTTTPVPVKKNWLQRLIDKIKEILKNRR